MSPLDAAQLSEVPRLNRRTAQTDEVAAALAGAGQLAEILRRTGAARIAVTVGDIQWEVEAPTAETTVVAAAAPAPEPVADAVALGHDLTAPLVGVFYRQPGPGKAPYVEVGDRVETGQQVAIVEAMKMLNEVVADRPGVIGAVYPADGDVVEFGQPLFRIDPA
ncbi:acetyl-CoA carboxylase biotin carboxyl carrier protein [Actinokineospora fastidiosa]|uniref:Biotin carboxyl carrier protein of acetyl-CoA carboxylase n=1 Tax=Actinokineospora fastidiosa TaxID=1816 RepID=A0A918GB37_9PSEU|nr:acetyl-CoA carboxylase biotin carboxyl carrier protein subunit [Actinokineospora fastidiosa]GGS24340.1 hypothetical protein GCM10010171_16870 [Actinokineospora fastidiosa]